MSGLAVMELDLSCHGVAAVFRLGQELSERARRPHLAANVQRAALHRLAAFWAGPPSIAAVAGHAGEALATWNH